MMIFRGRPSSDKIPPTVFILSYQTVVEPTVDGTPDSCHARSEGTREVPMARTAHHLHSVASEDRSQAGARGNEGHRLNRLRKRFVPVLSRAFLVVSITAAGLATGCTPSARPNCMPKAEKLAASRWSSLIAVVPRTSRSAATWGLRELARLLPLVASGGLQLHVLYSQDSDDLVEGGGDGGPPQVLLTSVPHFPAVHLTGAPASPSDPTSLSAGLYCGRLA